MGSYRWILLTLLLIVPLVTAAQDADPTPITPDEPITVTLTGEGPIALVYSAPEAQLITVTAQSAVADAIDPVLTIADSDENVLAYNDDSSRDDLSERDAAIEALELPDAGDYTILVDSFSGASQGEVIVTLTIVPEGTLPSAAEIGEEPLTFTQDLLGERAFSFPFEAQAGDTLNVTVRDVLGDESDIDPVIALVAPDGEIIAQNDDHDSADPSLDVFDSRLSNVVLSEAGVYTLTVREYRGLAGSVEITISLSRVEEQAVSTGGEVIEGEIQRNSTFEYEIELQEGDVITLTARAVGRRTTLDPTLTLLDDRGREVAYNDDHFGDDETLNPLDSRIEEFEIEDSGTYTIVIAPFSGFGNFELTIEVEGGD
jgi:hypothetical protein